MIFRGKGKYYYYYTEDVEKLIILHHHFGITKITVGKCRYLRRKTWN